MPEFVYEARTRTGEVQFHGYAVEELPSVVLMTLGTTRDWDGTMAAVNAVAASRSVVRMESSGLGTG